MIGATKLASHFGDKMFDSDTAKIVRKHAFWGALIMMIPAAGFELIIFCIILWHMYNKLCQRANTKLTLGNVIIGIVVNVAIAYVVDIVLMLLPIIGWLGTGFIVYLQYYLSGKLYIESLKKTQNESSSKANVNIHSSNAANHIENTQPQHSLDNLSHQPLQFNATIPQSLIQTPPPIHETMANNPNLLTCPDCGSMVSKHAECCPECGCPVSEMK